MGQTLTHGVYLPDEGERNCYNGLASNWSILDGAVGTVAEHTSALSGKAPLVHTHTKSDITDLFNSANTWSNVNTYTSVLQYKWLASGGYSDFRFKDQNDTTQFILRVYSHDVTLAKKSANGSNAFEGSQINFTDGGNLKIQTYDGTNYYIFNFTPTSVHPSSTNTQDLGTSSNKWKTLNGINPGALSLPDVSDGDPISTIGWSLTGARNTYTPTENGWFFIRVKGTASAKCSLNIHSGSYNDNYPTWVSYNDPTISLSTSLVVPAQKSVNLYVYIIAAEIEQLIFFPCLGNV